MLVVAHTAGGQSTLDLVVGTAILLWALATVTVLLGWLTRLPRRHRKGTTDDGRRHRRFGRLRRRERIGGDADPGQADYASATMTTVEHDADRKGDAPLGARAPDRPSEQQCSAAAARSPAIRGGRCSPETREPRAPSLDTTPRLQVAEARVAETLAGLPSDRWLVARYVLIAGHRIPFVVLGETGVFVICALTGPPAGTSCVSPLRSPTSTWDRRCLDT
jgi:hypothetical protein